VTTQTICGCVPSRHGPSQANIRERHVSPGRPVLPARDVVTVGGAIAWGG
jgi:hypothetical protein